ncbi:MAG: hypothetical protein M1838_004218 [Thelocarpon superellum]|nr:MAG: hypothetical protein M1838_004218 [Thelocarpon superellum]
MNQRDGPTAAAPAAPAAARFPHTPSKLSLSNGNHTGFSHGAYNSNQTASGYGDRHPRRANIASINTSSAQNNGGDLTTPGTAFDMQFTPLLPSQLLLGSPFQPGSPTTFASPQFSSFGGFAQPQLGNQHQNQQGHMNNGLQAQQMPLSPQLYQNSSGYAVPQLFSPQSPTFGYSNAGHQGMATTASAQMSLGPGALSGTSRTVYLGNIPPETSAEEILGHVRSGQIESVRLLPDKNCAFISFLDGSSATHFHSDAILKKLTIRGQDIKVGWGKPSQVPTSVALAVQQSGASRNVYLGNLSEDVTEEELREDLGKFGAIDTVKIVKEKAIAFVHFLSIGNAIKAVSQLPQEPKWQSPRRVYYGKDRCAYVSKTQQQNAAQYLGIAPGYAHVLNGADRDLISNALAQQSVAAAAVATSAGGVSNLGNRTVYLGNIHPETTIEEVCNVVRGGLLHHIRYIPDKHICFVTFIDPTSAASFYALSNLQGLMIHNRRLKIGWGKHSGALPPAIALAVSGGASRNVYVGNLDESWSEERLRQDFQEYGEIELVNTLREKSCAFVNFTNIANAIKAIEAVRGREDYRRFKINFGKDRCGNPPRQTAQNHQQHHNQPQSQQQQQQQQPQQQPQQQHSAGSNGNLGGAESYPSPRSISAGPPPGQSHSGSGNSPALSPAPGSIGAASSNGHHAPPHAPTPSAILNAGSNNPLTIYLNQVSSQQHEQQQQQQQQQAEQYHADPYSVASLQQQQQQVLATQQAALYNGTGVDLIGAALSESITPQHHFSHHHGLNGVSTAASTMGGLLAPSAANMNLARGQHARALSMPIFSQGPTQNSFNAQAPPSQNHSHHQHQHSGLVGMHSGFGGFSNGGFGGNAFGNGGFGAGGYGLAIQGDGGLNGWAEEEAGA